MIAKRAIYSGRVQGVGFRYWTQGETRVLGLQGWVRNRSDGRVEALFQGSPAAVERMLEACWRGPSFGAVSAVRVAEATTRDLTGFHIAR